MDPGVAVRIKRARTERGLTLKMVEAACGVSATHVSEIERGETTPTIGVLLRLAKALGRSPSYFLEEAELSDTSRVNAADRMRESRPGGAGVERLTASVPGGSLQASRITLAPGRSHRAQRHTHDGAEAILVMAGRVRVEFGDDLHELNPGDCIHYDASQPHAFTNARKDADAVLVWFASRRDVD